MEDATGPCAFYNQCSRHRLRQGGEGIVISQTMRSRVGAWLLVALSALSGCAAYDRSSLAANGPGSDLPAADATTFREAQDALIIQLVKASKPPSTSGLTNQPTTEDLRFRATDDVSWDMVIRAGMDYADVRCESYLHALYRLDRDRKTAVTQTGLLGGATAGVQAALGKAAKEVAIVAILFGLASSTIDNVASNLLYELEPSSVRTLVKAQQSQYRANLGTGYKDRPAAMTALRGYALLCVPASIESEVNLAVRRTQPETRPGDPAKGQPPVVTNSTIAVNTTSFGTDDASAKLNAFVNPGGRMNEINEKRLVAFIAAKGLTVGGEPISTTQFIKSAEYAAQRREAVSALGL